jgi:hypothetical protein
VDIEVLPDESTLFVLRGNGDVIRIRKNEDAANRAVNDAKAALRERNLSAALQDLDRAFTFYPPCAERVLAEPGMEPAGWVYAATIGESTPVSLFVDFLPGSGTGTPVLLDRWGRLFERNQEGFRRLKPPTEVSVSGTNAVGLAKGQPGEYRIGYRNGVIETWGGGERKGSLRVDLEGNDDMVSLQGIEDSPLLFAASSRGKIYRIDPRNGEIERFDLKGWDFPLAIRYLPESETAGYLLDIFGRVYNVGKCRIFTRYTEGEPAPAWKDPWGSDLAILPLKDGLVLLDKFGGLHPLGVELPRSAFPGLPYFPEPYSLRLRVTHDRFFIMDGNGSVYTSQNSE